MPDLFENLQGMYYDFTLNELRMMHENTLYPNIRYNGLLYLDLIAYKENCTVSFLAQALHISKSAVTIKVNELIKQGLVQKNQSEQDRRVFYLSPAKALDQEYKFYDERFRRMAEKIKQNFTEEETEKFGEMIALIRESYKQDLPGETFD